MTEVTPAAATPAAPETTVEAAPDLGADVKAVRASLADVTREVMPAEGAKNDAPKEAPKAEPPRTDEPQDARLIAWKASQEKMVREARKTLEAERHAFEIDRKAIEEERKGYAAWLEAKKIARDNPEAALETLGIDLGYLSKFILNGHRSVPMTTEEKLAAVERSVQEERAARETAENRAKEARLHQEEQSLKASRQAQLQGFEAQLIEHVQATDAFPLLKKNPRAGQLMLDTATDHYSETGRILSVEEAAQYTEQLIEESLALKGYKSDQAREQPGKDKPTQTAKEPPAIGLTQDILAEPTAKGTSRYQSDDDMINDGVAFLKQFRRNNVTA